MAKSKGIGATGFVLGPPQAADMHAYGDATSEAGKAYRERLDNVSATAATADNVLNVATDPKKMLGLLMLIGLVVLLVWLMKKPLQGVFGPVVKWFSSKKTESDSKNDVAAEGGTMDPSIAKLTATQAEGKANLLKGAFKWINDDEETVYNVLKTIRGDYNWLLVRNTFKTVEYTRWFTTRSYSLETALATFLNASEKDTCRAILTANGVTVPLNF